jgi:hypothetical protein
MGAIKSYPVAVELPPFPTRLKSTIFSPLVRLECSRRREAEPERREPDLSHYDPGFSRKVQNPPGSMSMTYPSNPYDRCAFTLSPGDFVYQSCS